MDPAVEEVINFWRMLQNQQVKYILTGDFAMYLHGHHLSTGVMSLWIEDTIHNRRQLRNALKECGLGDFKWLEQLNLVSNWTNLKLNNGLPLYIMVSLKGLENFTFNECWQLASIADIEDVQVPFLHINHLIANKVAVS